jgi:hypothetical protein
MKQKMVRIKLEMVPQIYEIHMLMSLFVLILYLAYLVVPQVRLLDRLSFRMAQTTRFDPGKYIRVRLVVLNPKFKLLRFYLEIIFFS